MPLFTPGASGSAATDTIYDAKGDLAAATGADAAAKLAVGNPGQTPMADPNATTGLKYATRGDWIGHRRTGALIETTPRALMGSAAAFTITSGTVYLFKLLEPLRAGVTYTSITFMSSSTALTAGGTPHQWFTLVNASTLATLRSTGDDAGTAWTASAEKTLNLSSTYTPTSDTEAYIGLMVSASTPPTLRNALLSTTWGAFTPVLAGSSTTGQTTPPADATVLTGLTAVTGLAWGYLS